MGIKQAGITESVLHPDRDVSLGRKNNAKPIRHPVRDASLNGMQKHGITVFSTERSIPNGMRF